MSTPPWGQEPGQQPGPPPPPPYGQQPGSPYQPYGGPPSPYGGYPTAPQTNGLAIASLVVSLGSVLLCCWFPGIVGAIMGHVARKQIRQQPNQTGEGMALAGIIVGWIAFGLAVLGSILYIVLIVILGVWAESVDCYTDSDGVYVCD
jgi:hypothetical protein